MATLKMWIKELVELAETKAAEVEAVAMSKEAKDVELIERMKEVG